MKYRGVIGRPRSLRPGRSGSWLRLRALEHLQHAVGDHEAADHVDRGGGDRDEAQDRAERARGRPPAATSEPTSEMPEMALVADISGVCSRAGTLVMTW